MSQFLKMGNIDHRGPSLKHTKTIGTRHKIVSVESSFYNSQKVTKGND
jgi:hypothetical protein